MANSIVIVNWKNQILSELQNDDEIVKSLNVHSDEDSDDLAWVRLFPHYYVPDVQEQVKTYICVEIDVQTVQNRYEPNKYNILSYPEITFYVLSHQSDMHMNVTGISATRTDYISYLLDKKYNGRNGFGVGRLQLVSNIAYSLNVTYRGRQLIFKTIDFNNTLCGDYGR